MLYKITSGPYAAREGHSISHTPVSQHAPTLQSRGDFIQQVYLTVYYPGILGTQLGLVAAEYIAIGRFTLWPVL